MATQKEWKALCKQLSDTRIPCKTPDKILQETYQGEFFVLKHDVECKVKKAYEMCKIEAKEGLRGVFYVQRYLLDKQKNVKLFKKMQDMGADICYHHDVMDSNGGDIDKAKAEFRANLLVFRQNGFEFRTVCQHGNPVMERVGYYSNRDFFRNSKVQEEFSSLSDIMVNFKEKVGNYVYVSDYGLKWNIVTDPENNDKIESKNIALGSTKDVLSTVKQSKRVIISVHPHRWHKNKLTSALFAVRFKLVRGIARILIKVPFFKKLMTRHFRLAKRI